ncbi:MAG: hypothetical protein ACREP9_07345, partial [Candidatus Dormibacteraceae bacterium]
GDARRAEHLLSQASEHVTSTSYPAISAWVEARRAEELARLGDSVALPLIERSLTHFAVSDPTVQHSWTNFFTPVRMDNFALNVYLYLGRRSDAEPLAKRAINSPGSAKFRPVMLADIAAVYLQTGNFEMGTEIASQAFDVACKMQSHWALGRLNNLHQLLRERADHDQQAAQLIAQFRPFFARKKNLHA